MCFMYVRNFRFVREYKIESANNMKLFFSLCARVQTKVSKKMENKFSFCARVQKKVSLSHEKQEPRRSFFQETRSLCLFKG